MKAFLESQFGYCALGWMFCNRVCTNGINHLHQETLRIVHNDRILRIIYNDRILRIVYNGRTLRVFVTTELKGLFITTEH